MIRILVIFLMCLPSVYALECSKFKAEGFYEIQNRPFVLTFLGCDSANFKDSENNIEYTFVLDGKTHSAVPNKLLVLREKDIRDSEARKLSQGWDPNKIAPIIVLEKVTYTSRLSEEEDGASIHLDVQAVVKPENNKGITRVHLKGHAAIYLRERLMKDCIDCRNPDLFGKRSYLQMWLGNIAVTKVEGGNQKDAEQVLVEAISKDPKYGNYISLEDKETKTPYEIGDLILVEKFKKSN